MKDKIRLLIEEAGIDEGQAELALEAVQYDVEKAIRNIGSLLRDFVVVKGKVHDPDMHVFGNIRTQHVVRLHTVMSYNPAIYETELRLNWFNFEKQIFTHRLQDGALQQLSQGIEHVLYHCFAGDNAGRLYTALREAQNDFIIAEFVTRIHSHVGAVYGSSSGLADPGVHLGMSIEREELNVTQYKQLEDEAGQSPPPAFQQTSEDTMSGMLSLAVTLVEDIDGIPVKELVEGVVVQSLIMDERDIANYLGRLMGGKSGSSIIPLSSPITKITIEDSIATIYTKLAPQVYGIAAIPSITKVKALYHEREGWWKRIFPW
jgi:hypothetical protein